MAPTGSAEKRARARRRRPLRCPPPRPAARNAEDGTTGTPSRRPRRRPPRSRSPHPPGASAAAPAKPALPNVDALATAKAVLQKQKELAAKLASVPWLANPAAAPSGADAARTDRFGSGARGGRRGQIRHPGPPATASAAPRALRLNAAGEEIDEDGNVIVAKVREVSTLKVNEKTNKLEEFAALERAAEAEAAAEDDDLVLDGPADGRGGATTPTQGWFPGTRTTPVPLDSTRSSVSVPALPFGFRFASFQSPADAALGGPHRRGDYSDAKSYFVSVARRESGCCPDRASRRWHIFPSRFSRRATRLDSQVTLCREDSSFLGAYFLCLRQRNLIGSWRRGIPHERNPLPSGQHLLGAAIFLRRARSSFPPRTRLGSPRPAGG